MNKYVFFDCWDTVISFKEKTKSWNTECLKRHCTNLSEVDFNQVEGLASEFLKQYYFSFNEYEITAKQFLTYLVLNSNIKLDCSIEHCTHDILSHLCPDMVPGLDKLLSYLDDNCIYYAILSNTIYDDQDTFYLVNKLVPNNHFRFFLGSAKIGVKKPNPLFFETGLKVAGAKSSEAIYIGDSYIADVLGSNRAKFSSSIWLNSKNKKKNDYNFYSGFNQASYFECHNYDEVTDLFKKKGI